MRLAVPCGAALIALAGAALADTLVFKDDLELSGPKVEVLREHEGGVDVKVSHGVITIRWPRIKKITIEFEDHLENMKSDGRDTARGLHEFMKVLVRHEMFKEAAYVAALILDKKHVAQSILLDVGRRMEARKQWALAKKAYEKFLAVNAARKDVMQRLDEVSKHVKKQPARSGGKTPNDNAKNAGENPNQPAPNPVAPQPKQPEPPKPPRRPKVWEGLEVEDDWVIEPWGSRATLSVVTEPKTGNKVLSVAYKDTDKDKVAARLGGTWDLTDQAALTFDAWNASQSSIGLTVAFNTMPGWQFFESISRRIPPKKWTTVRISLDLKRFKCEASKWRHISELKNRDNVKQIFLLIYNSSKTGEVYFNNIRFVPRRAAD